MLAAYRTLIVFLVRTIGVLVALLCIIGTLLVLADKTLALGMGFSWGDIFIAGGIGIGVFIFR